MKYRFLLECEFETSSILPEVNFTGNIQTLESVIESFVDNNPPPEDVDETTSIAKLVLTAI